MAYTLRVSVLEHCQLRCRYCLPQGSAGRPLKARLTPSQYQTLALAMRFFAIDKIRFTGGEPLLRKDLPAIIKIFHQELPDARLALTTNGLRFNLFRDDLIDAGLDAITFHLDTLREERFLKIMGQGEVRMVLRSVEQSLAAGLTTKMNVVVQRNVNEDELMDFLFLSRDLGVQVRFIELMNTGVAKNYVRDSFIAGKEIIERISAMTKITDLPRKSPRDPAELFWSDDLGISFGLIASDTRPFCGHCDRLRLSADGRLRTCLYQPLGSALPLASGDVAKLVDHIENIIASKVSFHPAMKRDRMDFSMSQIGG